MPKLNYGVRGGKGLSYSRLLEAHLCPRKFQLTEIFGLHLDSDSIHFSYGHAVAAGIQELVKDSSNLNRAVLACVAAWDGNIFEESPKHKKSLWYAIRMVQKFHELISNYHTNFLRDYKIAYFTDTHGNSKPAIELLFRINCYEDYVYEGHIDLVLEHKTTGKLMVLELKTTSFTNVDEASYKNSLQALGYAVVLDAIADMVGGESSYHVMYLIVKTGKLEFETMAFPKSKLHRAHFINSLVMDIETLEMYKGYGIYPMHGENCYNFFSQCEFFGICTFSDTTLQEMADKQNKIEEAGRYSGVAQEEYDFVFELDDIRERQLQDLANGRAELIASTAK